ncbi:hypothetical protein AGMMS49975_15590 [Clostridia bacterium]|nr:hypothetical protein AGMMS49975_15590 [Clostridia bacterium]
MEEAQAVVQETAIDIPAEYADAIEKLKWYISKDGENKSQAYAAKKLGISTGLVSNFLKGNYKAWQETARKVNALINITELRAVTEKEPPFKMTSISRHVTNTITYCHLQGKVGVAYGDAGVGKTMAAVEYCKNNPEAVMITTSPCYATITGVNELFADEFKIKECVSRKVFKELVRILTGSNKVLIIDEAQHLTTRVINYIRSISDASHIGIAFIGNEEVYLRMHGAGKTSYAQLFSRIGNKEHLLTEQIKAEDIRLVFEDANLGDESINLLHGISKTNYGLRGAVNVFINTITAFSISDYKDVTAPRLAKMSKSMGIV